MADATTIGKLVIQMLLDTQPFGEGTEKIEADTKKLGEDLKSLADGLNNMVVRAAQAAGLALAGLAAGSAVLGATFQQKMQYVGVVSGATAEELKKLEDTARSLGTTTTYSAAQAADAMALLAGAGLSASETVQATGDALAMAGVDGADLETSASALTATMAQFNLTAGDSGRIADVFARATAASQFKVTSLADAMKYGGMVGAGFGWTLEQTVAALMMFRDAGIEGGAAGTVLRSAMSQATMESKKNIDVMAKYGLMMADINPETKSFAEILLTVGTAGMSTTDALVVFGTEAGAVIKGLADQAAQGSTKYQDFLTGLETSAGSAVQMYSQMNSTVAGSFAVLRNSMEEVLISLFDTYKGPLMDLLNATTNVVQRTVQALRGVSGEVGASMDTALGSVTQFLNENAQYIASTLAGFVRDVGAFAVQVQGLMRLLNTLLPLLDDIALTMGLIWLSMKVATFVAAVENGIRVLVQMQWSLRALMAEITAATGGLYALVAAIGVLVAGLVTLIARYTAAERKARDLKAAQDALVAGTVSANAARAAELEAILKVQRVQAAQALQAEVAAGNITQARRTELEMLSRLTGATAQQLEAEGKLLLVRGQLRTAGSIAEDMDPEDTAAFNAQLRKMELHAKAGVWELEQLKAALANVDEARWQSGGVGGDLIASTLSAINRSVKTVAEAEARVAHLEQQVPQMQAAVERVHEEYSKAQTNMLAEAARTGSELADGAATLAEDRVGNEKEYVDRVGDLHQQLAGELARLGASDLQRVELDTQDRLAQVRAQYAEQMQLAQGNAAEQERLQRQMEQDLAAVTKLGEDTKKGIVIKAAQDAADRRAAEQERVQGLIRGLEAEGLTESQQLERDKAETLAGISDKFYQDKLRIAALYDARIKAVQAEEADEAKRKAEEEADARVSALERVVEAVGKARDVTDKIQGAMGKAWDAVTGAIGRVRSAIGTVAGAVQNAWSTVQGFTSDFIAGLERITGLSFSLSAAMSAITSAMSSAAEGKTSASGEAVVYVQEMLADAVGYFAALVEALPVLIEQLVAAVPQAVAALVAAVPEIVAALVAGIPVLVQAVLDAIPEIVGAFVAALPAVAAALAALIPSVIAALVGALPQVLDALLASLPLLVQVVVDAIPMLVDALVASIPQVVDALVTALPPVVQALVDSLPVVVGALVAALPELVQALVDTLAQALPTLVDTILENLQPVLTTLVDAGGQIIDALLAEVPRLIVGIVAMLPELVAQLLAQLPAIIQGLIAGIVQIVVAILEALPGIVEAIIQALPEIITALLEAIISSIPTILMAVVKAIPKIISAILLGIPDIIGSILAQVPNIITTLVGMIPDLIAGIAQSLPELLPALVALIPDLLTQIMTYLPEIVTALFEALFVELPGQLPEIALALGKAILQALRSSWDALVDSIGRLLAAAWDAITSIFGGGDDKGSHYGGIRYVPSTMRLTVHQGEMLVPAARNPARAGDRSDPALAGAGGSPWGGEPIEIGIFTDGRLVEKTLLNAQRTGKATQLTKLIRTTAGVHAGLNRGRLNRWK